MESLALIAFLVAVSDTGAVSTDSRYVDVVAQFPVAVTRVLVESNAPARSGAMGRNRGGYFHARFQLGVHRLADYAVAAGDVKAIGRFLDAVEYAFARQDEQGGFEFVLPDEYRTLGEPSETDLASGAAFFLASVGAGLCLLKDDERFRHHPRLQAERDRVAALEKKLPAALGYLIGHHRDLLAADGEAPNRLLYDGLAFVTLGKLVRDDRAVGVGRQFFQLACQQVHADGSFIEGGGSDTSYNAVATALAYRAGLILDDVQMIAVARAAAMWQISRLLPTGEVDTDGNTRVSATGESFLGRRKDVDVGYVVETLMFVAAVEGDRDAVETAKRTIRFYQQQWSGG